MKLTFLVDNNTLIDRYFLGEPGLSLFIEDQGSRVLFDVGYSDAFLRNAERMGIDLRHLDWLALSHGHLDHTWGLAPLARLHLEAGIEGLKHSRPALVAHPEVFSSRHIGPLPEIGCLETPERLGLQYKMVLSREPVWLTERLVFLGEIPRKLDFEEPVPVGLARDPKGDIPDILPDDTGLAFVSDRGLVVISGCAHAGICNTVEHARTVTGTDKVADVVGGFHLLDPDQGRLDKTARYLGDLGLDALHACHCTDLASKLILARHSPLAEVGVGLALEYGSGTPLGKDRIYSPESSEVSETAS